MALSIVIPAFNEENAVLDILRRTLKAAKSLRSEGIAKTVEVILVNDGSSDRTGELARSVAGVRVVDHTKNRGYGAAIKTGFAAAKGDWLGFLDADGTCDPEFFAELLRLAQKDGLDVAVGSRMHGGSKMPAVRVLGNWCFRTIVNWFGDDAVTDVASGMRVLKRSALERLSPLPDGLNFTPAMSVRAVLDPRLKIGETPMPYEERVGRSKLSVLRDGLRFLGVILDTAITFRPLPFFGAFALLAFAAGAWSLSSSWGAPAAPLPYYLENRRLEDWMIFRIILVTLMFSIAAFLAALGGVAQSLVALVNRDLRRSRWEAWFDAAVPRRFLWWGVLCLAGSLALNRATLASYFETGHIPSEYWVFPLTGSLLALVGVELVAFGLIGRIVRLLRERQPLS